ncbi:Mannose-6-phosphate isomerase [Clydaea vesicula]|uniref:Mannose-6-phosphate isomerase n=1 Tax=Clydaea vesicula TaxID=447962 RepID=A0AAD5TX40_9FUNG|nr:Mannose-6-phosphate isomerase [Clydaea vesicula]
MAIALTRFEGLCGFKSLEAILKTIEENSELRSVIGMDTYRSFKITIQDFNATEEDRKLALKQVFKSLISCDRTLLQTELQNIVYRLKDSPDIKINGTTAELVNRLWSQFPNDVGIFCALLLNYICLNPGEAFFMAANEPHAYLSGDCVECMATSDNVVRAGLTPKLIDVDTLVEMLTYNHGEQRLLQPHYYHSKKYNKEFQHTLIFDPPIPEFFMMYTELQSTNFEFDPIDGPSMVIVLEGNGTFEVNNEVDKVAVGDVLFLASGSELIVNSVDGVKFCRAVCFVEEIL